MTLYFDYLLYRTSDGGTQEISRFRGLPLVSSSNAILADEVSPPR